MRSRSLVAAFPSPYVGRVSNCVGCQVNSGGSWPPGLAIADDGVEDGQQLPHAGYESELAGLAGGEEPLVEGTQHGIEAAGCQGSHIEHLAHGGAATPNDPLSAKRAAVAGMRRDADQRGNLFSIQSAKFGQFGQGGKAGHSSYARDTAKQVVLGPPDGTLPNAFCKASLDALDLALEPAHMSLDPAAHFRRTR